MVVITMMVMMLVTAPVSAAGIAVMVMVFMVFFAIVMMMVMMTLSTAPSAMAVVMPLAMLVMMMLLPLTVAVLMDGNFTAAEQTPRLGRGQQIRYFRAGGEMISDIREMMGAHHGIHDVLIHGKGDIDLALAHHGRPVLIAQGMSQGHASFHEHGQGQMGQRFQIDDQDFAEIDLADHRPAGVLVPQQHVAVVQKCVAIQ